MTYIGQGNRGRQNRSYDMEEWMGANVGTVGRTAEDRLMYRISIKAATSGTGLIERDCTHDLQARLSTDNIRVVDFGFFI